MPKVPIEVTKESYLLKSTFFYNKLQKDGYFDLFMQVQNLCNLEGSKLNWSQRADWKISDIAWKTIKSSSLDPMLVFVHPKILQLNPSFLKYYRSVAMIPQKGLKSITGVSNVERIEGGKVEAGALSSAVIEKLISSINEVLSLVITLSTDISENEIQGMMYATAGINIEGSWRNAIGSEGERVIRSIILRELLTQKDISSFCDRQNKTKAISEFDENEILDSIENIKTVYLKNGCSMVFSSEPDIILHDDCGATVGVIEIKAGLDPAGALERLGAMLKSFENTLAEYPNAITILVASCITDEVETRLSASMSVRQKYITANVTSNESSQRKFANSVRKILKLT
ncbi:MAG: XcyI family restriction endonuclease [Lachnospiraceae bacterium]|nr:XcyI family restriction endonuclease [Lachnospiraceae bacterium]